MEHKRRFIFLSPLREVLNQQQSSFTGPLGIQSRIWFWEPQKNHNYSTKTASCFSLLNSIQQSFCSGNKNNMSLKWGIVCKWWFGKQCCWHSLIQAHWRIFSIIKNVTAAESDAQNYTMLYNHFKLQRNVSGCVLGHLQFFLLIKKELDIKSPLLIIYKQRVCVVMQFSMCLLSLCWTLCYWSVFTLFSSVIGFFTISVCKHTTCMCVVKIQKVSVTFGH